MVLTNELARWSCAEFKESEDFAVEQLTKVSDSRFINSCARLNSWKVFVQPVETWRDEYWRDVGGLTYCVSKTIYVGSQRPLNGSLCHEMAHAIQECQPNFDASCEEDDYHKCWKRDGIFKAIDECYKKSLE